MDEDKTVFQEKEPVCSGCQCKVCRCDGCQNLRRECTCTEIEIQRMRRVICYDKPEEFGVAMGKYTLFSHRTSNV